MYDFSKFAKDAANPYSSTLKGAAQQLRSAANRLDGAARTDSLFKDNAEYRASSLSGIEFSIMRAVELLHSI